jgi:glycosyltransferase involved in cell wall biosynthesis
MERRIMTHLLTLTRETHEDLGVPLTAFLAQDLAKASPPHPSIAIDVTDLLAYARAHDTLSGIQRVIVKVISGLIESHGAESVSLIAFDQRKRVFLRAGAEFFAGDYVYDQDIFCRYFKLNPTTPPRNAANLRDYVALRYAGKPLKRRYNYFRLMLANRLNNGRSFAKRNIVEAAFFPEPSEKVAWSKARFDKNDRVLVLGALWDFPAHAAALAKAKAAAGFAIYRMAHDLIPLVTPEHVSDDVRPRFEKYVDDVFRSSDVILANSRATAKDIERYGEALGASRPVVVVPLAHEFLLGTPVERPPRILSERPYRLPRHLTQRTASAAIDPYALVVGTIESRKNISRLIRVWAEMHRNNPLGTPTLVLAGRAGFRSDEIFRTLSATGNLHGKILVIDRPDDGEVAFLFANCLFSICLSYYEGWGLPVGESLWFGRPVLASKTSSLPEVGGKLADYCDPYDDRDIEQKLTRLIVDEEYRREREDAIKQATLRTWTDVSRDLRDALRIGHEHSQHRTMIEPDSRREIFTRTR